MPTAKNAAIIHLGCKLAVPLIGRILARGTANRGLRYLPGSVRCGCGCLLLIWQLILIGRNDVHTKRQNKCVFIIGRNTFKYGAPLASAASLNPTNAAYIIGIKFAAQPKKLSINAGCLPWTKKPAFYSLFIIGRNTVILFVPNEHTAGAAQQFACVI